MKAPNLLINHLRKSNYHPRSDKHSNFLCDALLDDLLDHCPEIARKAASGELVANPRHKQTIGHDEWVIDLALGEPASTPRPPNSENRINVEKPAVIQIAIEAKSVMTEHKKARKNRLRDLHAFHTHAHNYNQKTVAAGLVIINASQYFWSPLRKPDDITNHRDTAKIVGDTIDTFRSVHIRNEPTDQPGMEAMGLIIVEHDNLALNPGAPVGSPKPVSSRLTSTSLAPQPGDPLHYSTMIRRICNAYTERF